MKIWIGGLVFASALGMAQGPERMSIAFRDAARPGTVKMNALNGSITVKPHSGKEVIVEFDAKSKEERDVPESAKGLKRLSVSSGSMTLEEENNVVTVSSGWRNHGQSVVLLVPAKTSLKLSTVNGKMISVEGVEGEMELNTNNGSVQLSDVSGSAVVHALNGRIMAKFKRVDTDKPMSFSSMNGTIDVTLPAATKALLKMQTNNGEVFTDFDVQIKPNSTKVETANSNPERNRNRVRMESASQAAINGGGPDYTFKNFNGNIYIRKGN